MARSGGESSTDSATYASGRYRAATDAPERLRNGCVGTQHRVQQEVTARSMASEWILGDLCGGTWLSTPNLSRSLANPAAHECPGSTPTPPTSRWPLPAATRRRAPSPPPPAGSPTNPQRRRQLRLHLRKTTGRHHRIGCGGSAVVGPTVQGHEASTASTAVVTVTSPFTAFVPSTQNEPNPTSGGMRSEASNRMGWPSWRIRTICCSMGL